MNNVINNDRSVVVSLKQHVPVNRDHTRTGSGNRDRTVRNNIDLAGTGRTVVDNIVVKLDNRQRIGFVDANVTAGRVVDINGINRRLEIVSVTDTGNRVDDQSAIGSNHVDKPIAAVGYAGARGQCYGRVTGAGRNQAAKFDTAAVCAGCGHSDRAAAGIDLRAVGHDDFVVIIAIAGVRIRGDRDRARPGSCDISSSGREADGVVSGQSDVPVHSHDARGQRDVGVVAVGRERDLTLIVYGNGTIDRNGPPATAAVSGRRGEVARTRNGVPGYAKRKGCIVVGNHNFAVVGGGLGNAQCLVTGLVKRDAATTGGQRGHGRRDYRSVMRDVDVPRERVGGNLVRAGGVEPDLEVGEIADARVGVQVDVRAGNVYAGVIIIIQAPARGEHNVLVTSIDTGDDEVVNVRDREGIATVSNLVRGQRASGDIYFESARPRGGHRVGNVIPPADVSEAVHAGASFERHDQVAGNDLRTSVRIARVFVNAAEIPGGIVAGHVRVRGDRDGAGRTDLSNARTGVVEDHVIIGFQSDRSGVGREQVPDQDVAIVLIAGAATDGGDVDCVAAGHRVAVRDIDRLRRDHDVVVDDRVVHGHGSGRVDVNLAGDGHRAVDEHIVSAKSASSLDVMNGQGHQVNDVIHIDIAGSTGIHGEVVTASEEVELNACCRGRLGPRKGDISPITSKCNVVVDFGVGRVDLDVPRKHNRRGIDEVDLSVVGADIASKSSDAAGGDGQAPDAGRGGVGVKTFHVDVAVGGGQGQILGSGHVAVEGEVAIIGGQFPRARGQKGRAVDRQILAGGHVRVELGEAGQGHAAGGRVDRGTGLDVDRVGRCFGCSDTDRSRHGDDTGEDNGVAGIDRQTGQLGDAASAKANVGIAAVDGQAVPALQAREAYHPRCVGGGDGQVIVNLHRGQAVQGDAAGGAACTGGVDVTAEVEVCAVDIHATEAGNVTDVVPEDGVSGVRGDDEIVGRCRRVDLAGDENVVTGNRRRDRAVAVDDDAVVPLDRHGRRDVVVHRNRATIAVDSENPLCVASQTDLHSAVEADVPGVHNQSVKIGHARVADRIVKDHRPVWSVDGQAAVDRVGIHIRTECHITVERANHR